MKKQQIIMMSIIAIMFIIGIIIYPMMPEKVASHWNEKGEINDYSSKFIGTFLMPLIGLAIYLLFLIIPKLDNKRIKSFKNVYNKFVIFILFFLLYIYILTLLPNLGFGVNMSEFIILGIGIMFFYMSNIFTKIKQNHIMGIKTPWTLTSKNCWNKTHELGSKIFKVIGILFIIIIFIPKLFSIPIIILILSIIYIYIYSYKIYKEEKKSHSI